ncbi:MAG: hypothetical protein WKF75_02870 [Singulisphaera sp.]
MLPPPPASCAFRPLSDDLEARNAASSLGVLSELLASFAVTDAERPSTLRRVKDKKVTGTRD